MKYDLIDLIDIEKTQRLLQNFMEAGGIPAAIIDLKGVVLVTSSWQRVCTEFHRVNETTCRRCIESDTVLANALLEGKTFSLYRCQNGLTDAASPIIIEGEHLANAFIGQFFTEKPDLEFFRRQARERGFDESAYLGALSKIRIVREDTLPSVLAFLTSFAEMMASLGLKQLEQLESEKELRKAQQKLEIQYKKLRENEEDLNRAQTVAHIGSRRMSSRHDVLRWSDETYRIFGIPKGVPMTCEALLAIVHPEDRELVDRSWQKDLRGAPSVIEYRILVGDTVKWVQEQTELELDEQGAWRGGFGTVQDITDRKRAEGLIRVRLDLLEFATSHSTDELLQKALDEITALTNSPIGFLHFVASDQKTLVLQTWSTRTVEEFCKADGKGLHYPIAKAGVWVDCVHEKRPVIHNNYSALPHRRGMPEGHPVVVRELVVPIMRADRVVAILGIGNKPADYTHADVEVASYLADVAWEITMRKRAEEELRKSHDHLELRIQERTAELLDSKERLRLLASELITAEENERKRIAREIHDGLCSQLSAIKFYLERNHSLNQDPGGMEQAVTMIRNAIEETRRIMANLRPSVLDDLGIAPTITWLSREFQKINPAIHFDVKIEIGEQDIPENTKIVIFRLLQEALNNVQKHSRADRAEISLERVDSKIVFCVNDNGLGFSPEKVQSGKQIGHGFGLSGMLERVELSGGKCEIESSPDMGVSIRAEWEIQEKKSPNYP